MRVPTRERGRGLKFDITPLIDVVFLLIIFFLAASHFARTETAEAVELPEATQQADDDQAETPRRLVVTITENQKFHVRGREVTTADVDALLERGVQEHGRDFEVRFRGDKRVPFDVVEPLLVTCSRNGVTNVKFAVLVE